MLGGIDVTGVVGIFVVDSGRNKKEIAQFHTMALQQTIYIFLVMVKKQQQHKISKTSRSNNKTFKKL